MIQRRWRSWLTTAVIGRWLANGRYYQLNLIGGDHKNPEARISEDLRIATEAPVDFIAGVISAFLAASTFIVVLWTIGGALTLPIAGFTVTIPGFLVVTAVLYAAITSSSMAFIGRRFVQVSEAKNQTEAEFRYTLTHDGGDDKHAVRAMRCIRHDNLFGCSADAGKWQAGSGDRRLRRDAVLLRPGNRPVKQFSRQPLSYAV